MYIEFLNSWKKFKGITFISFGIYNWGFNQKKCVWGTIYLLNFGIKFRIDYSGHI